MEDFMVAYPLVPGMSRLLSSSCSSPRAFVPRFLQTTPHGDALALLLSFASTELDRGLSPPSIETCPAHTLAISRAASRRRCMALLGFFTFLRCLIWLGKECVSIWHQIVFKLREEFFESIRCRESASEFRPGAQPLQVVRNS